MKRIFLIFVLAFFIVGCHKPAKNQRVLAKINNYELTEEQFETEFKNSSHAAIDTLESRKDFLNNLINKKLILQDAERQNLHKQKNFLKNIERFWEQSLIKIALDKKAKEILELISISEKDIQAAYENLAKSGQSQKPYQEARGRIKWELISLKESQLMNDWLEELHKDARITINRQLLEEDTGGEHE